MHALAELEANAGAAAAMLRQLANANRLRILCELVGHGEVSVGGLVNAVGLGQSAVSQHLARLREEGLVASRRDGQAVLYRIADTKAVRILVTLRDVYCGPPATG